MLTTYTLSCWFKTCCTASIWVTKQQIKYTFFAQYKRRCVRYFLYTHTYLTYESYDDDDSAVEVEYNICWKSRKHDRKITHRRIFTFIHSSEHTHRINPRSSLHMTFVWNITYIRFLYGQAQMNVEKWKTIIFLYT